MKKPLSRWTKIVTWTIFAFFALCLITFGVVLFITLKPSLADMINMGMSTISILVFYLVFLLAWFIFRKNKSLVKLLQDAIPFLFIGGVLYFWNIASSWENKLGDDWAVNPLLSNASVTLEYVKALVKTVMLCGGAIIVTLYLKSHCDRDTKHDSEITKQ